MRREPWSIALLACLALTGCARPSGPPAIVKDTPCYSCGMEITDLRFACERRVGRQWRAFDSIECMIGDSTASDFEVLTDWESRTLHAADSLWVVDGALAGPMGSCAAFASRATADEIASARGGHVARLAELRRKGMRS